MDNFYLLLYEILMEIYVPGKVLLQTNNVKIRRLQSLRVIEKYCSSTYVHYSRVYAIQPRVWLLLLLWLAFLMQNCQPKANKTAFVMFNIALQSKHIYKFNTGNGVAINYCLYVLLCLRTAFLVMNYGPVLFYRTTSFVIYKAITNGHIKYFSRLSSDTD